MEQNNPLINRRHMLKRLGLGSLGCLIPGLAYSRTQELSESTSLITSSNITRNSGEKSRVSIVQGGDGRMNTYEALMNIEEEIMASLEGKKRILVKPNIVSTTVPLSATHVDSVRGILEFLRPRWKGPILVGESTAARNSTMEGFQNFGYLPLEKEFNIELRDLNTEPVATRHVVGRDNIPHPIRIISTFLDRDTYIISAAKMKTHDRVLVTLTLKNVLLAAPLNDYQRNDKSITHQTSERSKNTILHYNMFRLAQETYPDLGVLDGFEAMEGNGPVRGTPVDARLAMASLDPLALDVMATQIMGFNPAEVLYFSSLSSAGLGEDNPQKITTVGSDIRNLQFRFQPHQAMIEPYGLG